MPNHASTEKDLRKVAKRRPYNIAMKSRLRTLVKKVREAVEEKNKEAAQVRLRAVVSALDTAAKRNIIHHRNASRKKSRLTQLVNSLNQE